MPDKPPLRQSTCRHCHGPIFYSTFTDTWNHMDTADRYCRRVEAEPLEDE